MLLYSLREKMGNLTATQRKIARFILDYPSEAAFLTATQLGDRLGVSQSTVVRFAAQLGFEGYPQMRAALKDVIMEKLTTKDRLKAYGEEEPEGNICLHALHDDLEALTKTIEGFDAVSVEKASRAIVGADHVFIVGHLSSRSLAYFLWYYLVWFFPNTHLVDKTLANELFVNATEKSLAIGISFPRYTRWTVETLEFAKKTGMHTAAICSGYDSPLADVSDVVISVPWKPLSFIDSFTAPMSVINCLLLNTAMIMGPSVQEKLAKLERMWKENQVYAD
jgi:DNA-binding MurR/RpiR family transcriptional regulator